MGFIQAVAVDTRRRITKQPDFLPIFEKLVLFPSRIIQILGALLGDHACMFAGRFRLPHVLPELAFN